MTLPPPLLPHPGWPFGESAEPATAQAPPEGGWPRISIVIPSFNQGGFLEAALRSVLLQAYPELELIVQDGGSRDQSREVLAHYHAVLTSCASERDGGQSDAINRGLARATGDLVTFIGSDDLYLPGAFAEVARLHRAQPDAGAIAGAFRFMDQDGTIEAAVHSPRLPHRGPLDLSLADPESWRLHQVATFFTRHALDLVGRSVRADLRYTMDRDLLYRVARQAPVATTTRVLAAFRRHPTSKSVGEALPFYRELADLHAEPSTPGEPRAVHRRRQRLHRYWRAKGALKAATGAPRPGALPHLLRCAAFHPPMLWKRRYLVAWLECLCLLVPLRAALPRAPRVRVTTS